MNCESFKSWIWCLLFVGHLLVKGFQWKLFTWYHTNLVVSTKQELGFFLFHFLCLSSSSRGAFDQATCVTSDAESWQTETLSIRFENLTWGTEKWKQCHRPHGHTTLIERLLSPKLSRRCPLPSIIQLWTGNPFLFSGKPKLVLSTLKMCFLLECCTEWIINQSIVAE